LPFFAVDDEHHELFGDVYLAVFSLKLALMVDTLGQHANDVVAVLHFEVLAAELAGLFELL
jgi:hypothetical protein